MLALIFLGYTRIKLGEYVGLSSFQFLAFFRRLLIYTFLAIYLGQVIGLSTTEVTLMATIPMIASASFQAFIWGPVIDKTKQSVALIGYGELFAGFGHVLMFWLHKFYYDQGLIKESGFVIIGVLTLIEFGWSASNVGWVALIAEKTDSDERTKLYGNLSVIGGLGGIFGARIGGLYYDSGVGFSEGMLFYIAAGVMAISAGMIFLTNKNVKVPKDQSFGLSRAEKDPEENRIALLEDLPSSIKKAFIWFIIALIFINFGRNSVALIINLYLVDGGGFAATDKQIADYSNLWSGASLITGMSVWFGKDKISDGKLMLLGSIMSIIGLIWFTLASTFIWVLISATLLGSVYVLIQASSYGIVARIIPEEYRGRMFAYYNVTFFLSWGVGGTLINGPIADYLIKNGSSRANAYEFTFFVAAGIVFIGIAFLLGSYRLIGKLENPLDRSLTVTPS